VTGEVVLADEGRPFSANPDLRSGRGRSINYRSPRRERLTKALVILLTFTRAGTGRLVAGGRTASC
jgi:hypothetical protein